MDSVLSPPSQFQFDGNSLDLASGALSQRWSKWRKGYEIYIKACEIDKKSEEIQINILLHVIGDQCREILEQLNAKFKTAKEILEGLDEHFKTKKNVTVERHRFFTRDQKENETIEQYVFELRRLSTTCEFQTLNEQLIKDRLVCGVKSSAIRERLLREEDLDLKKALEICRVAVVSRVYSENIRRENEHVYKIEGREEENSGVFSLRRGVTSWRSRGGIRGRGRGARHAGGTNWTPPPPAPPGVRSASTASARTYEARGATQRSKSGVQCGQCGNVHKNMNVRLTEKCVCDARK